MVSPPQCRCPSNRGMLIGGDRGLDLPVHRFSVGVTGPRPPPEARAAQALQTMSRNGKVINFVAVARKAGVSTDFLYRHPLLRARVIALRTATSGPALADPTRPRVAGAGHLERRPLAVCATEAPPCPSS
jgi:hypothetical protein